MGRRTINFSHFLSCIDGVDHTPCFDAAMEYLRENPYTTLVIDPGKYNITRALARETQKEIMEGKYGDEDIIESIFRPDFPYSRGICFAGQNGTVVEAYGVTLMVDGFMEPVSIRDCENVEIRGLTIDHKRKPYSKAVIKNVGELDELGCRRCELEFDPETPIPATAPRCLRASYFDTVVYRNLRCYIAEREVIDEYHWKAIIARAEKLHDGVEYYTIHTEHFRPAILIENAKNTVLRDVTIHSQPGMGVVGHRSENITLSHLSVVPSAGHHYSTNTDATHFTAIKGLLRFENCVFESQGDDFTNVHLYYQYIIERISNTEFLMQEKTPDGTHSQSLDYPDAGDILELTDAKTLELIDTFNVVECIPMPDKWCCRVKVDHALPENTDGLIVGDISALPVLEIVNCQTGPQFARGIVIKNRNALIENNTFHCVDGPAIFIAPEPWWCEGTASKNITIRGNRIVKCGDLVEYSGGIVILSEAEAQKGQCMENIIIENNIIDCPDTDNGIYIRDAKNVYIRRNRIVSRKDAVAVENCEGVVIEE